MEQKDPLINHLPIIIFSLLLAGVLLLLIFNPFKGFFSTSSSTSGSSAATSGTTMSSASADPDDNSADDHSAQSNNAATVKEDTDADSSVPESTESDPDDTASVKETAASVLDADKLRQIMNSAGSGVNYSVCIADLSTGEYTGVNYDDKVSASAMVDIPILYTAAYMISQNKLSLSDGITFHYSVGGRGTLKSSDDGRRISLEELLRAMLQYSDNNATNTLLDYFGMDTIENVCASNGFDSVSLNGRIMETKDNTSSDNYVSARDLCGMIYHIYTDRFPSINKSFLYKNMVLKDSTADSGLCGKINCSYYNLNGVKADKYNEIAIIDNGKTPYVVAYLANSALREDLEDVASTLGGYIHQRVDSIN